MPKTTLHGGGSIGAPTIGVPRIGEGEPAEVEESTTDDTAEETTEGGDGYDSWTNDELRTELSTRELPTSGNKAELVARLVESDEAAVDTE